jgi:hypothetical protein
MDGGDQTLTAPTTSLTLRGERAEIRWGYQVAVTVGRWTLRVVRPMADGVHWAFDGDVRACHGLAVRQRPLTLVVPRPRGAWRWPVVSLTVSGATVVAELGPKDEEPHVPLRPA